MDGSRGVLSLANIWMAGRRSGSRGGQVQATGTVQIEGNIAGTKLMGQGGEKRRHLKVTSTRRPLMAGRGARGREGSRCIWAESLSRQSAERPLPSGHELGYLSDARWRYKGS